jgi:ATP-binding cassette subfamily C protein
MRFLIKMTRAYPGQSVLMFFAMLLAALAEGFGFSAMIPLLSTAVDSQAATGQVASSGIAENGSTAERLVRESLEFLGVPPTIEVLIVVILAAIILKSILMLVANKRIGYTVAHVATDLRLSLLRALLASRWAYHLRQPVGALANSIATEAQRACQGYLAGAFMIIALIQAVVFLGVAFLVSWKATFVALTAGLLIFYALKHLIGKARRAGSRQTQLLKSLLAHLMDSLQALKPLKAMALEKLAESILFKETNKLNKALRRQVLSKEYLRAFQEPLRAAILLFGLYTALFYLRLPLTTVLILIFLIARVLNQLGKVQLEYQKMVLLESGYWSLKETIREAEEECEEGLGSQLPVLQKSIQFKQVSFAYEDQLIFKTMSLEFPAGRITAIIGPSGSGKTTVVDLVIGLLRPQQGDIWIDDLPLEQIDLRKWRQLIGYVPQEFWLLHDTVLNNVTLGDPELAEKDAEHALRAAGIWEFVKDMPKGINSTVGERGGKISGGQRQRIAIARALVHKPKLLILDEATTALDPENEAAICETLRKLRGEITILAISHQPAVMEVADHAYRLQNGAVATVKIASATDSQSEENREDSDRDLQLATGPAKL